MSNVENLNPQITRHIIKELESLRRSPIEGITVLLNEKDVTEVDAIIVGPEDTPYAGGNFRIKMIIGKEFPSSPPKCYFLTKIFHPNVSDKGEICVNTLKRDWKDNLGLKHIFLTIKCLLIVPNPESALNEEAGKLLLEHYKDYCARARLYTEIHARGETISSPKTTNNASSTSLSPSTSISLNSSTSSSSSSSSSKINKLQCKTKKDKSLKDKKKILKRL